MKIIAYNGTQSEQDRIIAEETAQGQTLVAVSNVIEGNFLGFMVSAEILQSPKLPTPIEDKIQTLEAKIDTMLLKQDEIKAGQVATKEASIAVK